MSTEALYVDARRTHEVRVSIERRGTTDFVIRESARGSRDMDEMYVERRVLTEAWELKMLQMRLETRLALLGAYYREVPGGWAPIRPAQAEPVDLTPLDTGQEGRVVDFHHFTLKGDQVVTLIGVHQDTARGPRSMLARLDYRFPDAQKGNLQIVHAKLPAAVYRSALASLHLDLREMRYHKMPSNADVILDATTWAEVRAALNDAVLLLAEQAGTKSGILDGIGGKAADLKNVVALAQAARRARGAANAERSYDLEFELDGEASKVAGKKQEILIEDLSPDVFAALQDPGLVALHARFLPPAEEASLIARGERIIHAHARKLRERVRPDEYHLVSLLEASLLLRYALKNRIPVDPNVIKRVQHARAYL